MQESFRSRLLKPRKITVSSRTPFLADIEIEPLERGFGHTLGNALRRILLSTMPGAAITEARIEGVLHEYSTIEGVHEDVVEILLNLKGIALRIHEGTEAILRLEKEEEGEVKVKDLKLPAQVEALNPEHVICRLSGNMRLSMELKAEVGQGYQAAGSGNRGGERPIGTLLLDASFSPVRRVAFEVESARVEQRTDLDRLVLHIETNGGMEAKECLQEAAKILLDQFGVLANLEAEAAPHEPTPLKGVDPFFLKSVESLDLSTRSLHILQEEGISTVGDLVRHTEAELMRLPALGRKALNEIKESLASRGLSLGMRFENLTEEG